MHIVVVSIHVKPEHVDAFQAATVENGTNSRREPGILRFDFLRQADDPTRFLLIEVYRDPSAQASHRETAHYQAWAAKVGDMLAEPRTRQIYTNVDPPDAGW
jgi:autoinducer 2-degrading protein